MRVPNSASSRSRRRKIALAALLLICTGVVNAQSDDGQPGAGDPPTRVARLSYATGDLGLMPAGSTNWSAADVNRPLTNGDKLSGGPDARAELDLGNAALRINGQSDIGVLNLNEQIGQFEVTQGTLNITVRNLDQGSSYEIDTPTLALVIDQPGTFRVDVDGNGASTTVTAFSGAGMVYGENNAQRDVIQWAQLSVRRFLAEQCHRQRDQWRRCVRCLVQRPRCRSTRNEDAQRRICLRRHGRRTGSGPIRQLADDDDYGAVWYPADVACWLGAVYRFGHWVWIAPWGWTWVDNLPWGFAPYHYGRWAFIRGALGLDTRIATRTPDLRAGAGCVCRHARWRPSRLVPARSA